MGKFALFYLSILSFSLFWSCQPKLERDNIPVWAGITLEEDNCQIESIDSRMDIINDWGLSGLSVEIPLEVNPGSLSGSFKYYENHPIDTLILLIQRMEIPYSLAFDLRNPRSTPLKSIDWKKQFTQISGLLLRTANYPPNQIIFMGELVDPHLPPTLLSNFVAQIKVDFEPFQGEITYAYFPEVINDSIDFQTPDLIGIRYHQAPEEELIPFYRKTNQAISQKLIEWQKPGVVVQTNLLGEDKDDQFRYQLRYWDEKAEIRGMFLNTLYCELSLTEKGSFFGLGEDEAFQTYLKQYLK
jgi:hypothetical protein